MKETIMAFLGFVLVISLVLILMLGVTFIGGAQCKSAYENYQPQWGLISGCRIVVDGKLTPVDIVRELN